ncbi:MAG: hypothetical protein JOZ05_20375 [Acetobacteraceae bacterium]|nr:hypothetical protein [Acetobacteraceae bacterium]
MIGQTSRRASRLLLLTAAIVGTAFGGAALAAADSISIEAPTHARVNVSYRFTVKGFAAKSQRLYFFNDVDSCGANPHVEHAVHNANGDDFMVDGAFREVSKGWRSPKATTYHVCAYLVKASEPFNGAGGVIKRASTSFKVS